MSGDLLVHTREVHHQGSGQHQRDGAQEYSIGNRTFKRVAMADLQLRRDRLKAIVVRERKAAMIANGLGDPHSLYVRF